MPDRVEISGSPRPDPCTNMESRETATLSSAQAMSTEIHEHGDTIVEVRIRRTRNNHYLITLVTGKEEGEAHVAGRGSPGRKRPPFSLVGAGLGAGIDRRGNLSDR